MLIKLRCLYIFQKLDFSSINMIKKYMEYLLKNYPKLKSGRKEYEIFEDRILKNIKLAKIMKESKNIKLFMKKTQKNNIK